MEPEKIRLARRNWGTSGDLARSFKTDFLAVRTFLAEVAAEHEENVLATDRVLHPHRKKNLS